MGGQFVYISIALGALPVIFGCSLIEASLIIVIASTFGSLIVALGGILGPRTHTATIVNTRAVFGIKGNLPVELFNLITAVGWAAENSVLATLALIEILEKAGWQGTSPKVISAIVVVLGQVFIAMIGRDAVEKSEKIFAAVSALFIFGLLGFAWKHVHWTYAGAHLADKGQIGTMLLAAAVIACGTLSYVSYASDYTRYYTDETNRTRIVLYSGGGLLLSSLICYLIGAALATAVNMNNPISNLPKVMPGWYLIPFLFVVIWSCIANNVLNTYTASLALLALHVNVQRWLSVLAAGVLSAGFVYYCLFVSNFDTSFENFLLVQLLWLCPWVAMELVDYILRQGRYDIEGLHSWGSGVYWYRRGVNWKHLLILFVAIGAAVPFTDTALIHNSWDINTLGGADVSYLVGMVVGGGLYWLVSRHENRDRTNLVAPPHPRLIPENSHLETSASCDELEPLPTSKQ
jgi:purine-cytosine permease-like protein